MKTILTGLVLVLISATSALSATTAKKTPQDDVTIQQATDAQMFRYGRELFRKGDYAEAAHVFQRILTIDCKHRLAQYHLQQIAALGENYKNAADFLKNLPCPAYDFSEEDFLPSSFYYEKDADLILEQLALYNKRYRSTKSELSLQIDQYKNMIGQLEEKTQSLSVSLDAAQKDAAQAELLKKQLDESTALSKKLSQEAAQLKTQIETSRAEYAKESAALQAKVSAYTSAEQKKAAEETLAKKELEITMKSQELMTLQDKFAVIQERLRQIESALTRKNSEIKKIGKDLSTIEK